MKVALIWPKSTFLVEPMYYPPLGLFYVWGALRGAGHDATFFDLAEDALPTTGYDQYWVSGTTPQVAELRRVGDELRTAGGHAVLGGPHAFFHQQEMLEYYDVVVKGEVHSADAVTKVFETPRGGITIPRPASLVDLPLPVRDAATRYKARLRGRRCTTMMTSLGCPYRCAFCNSPELWGKVRYASLAHVEADLLQIKALGFGAVQFYDDILPLNPSRTLQIVDMLSKLGLIWRCFIRSDLGVHRGFEFLKMLRDGGLVEVLVGVESADDQIKRNVHKGTTTEQDTLFRNWCRVLGISYKASILLGLPGETIESMEATRHWLLKNLPDRADINVLVPMPGTPLFDRPEEFDCIWTQEVPDEYFFKGKPGEAECLVRTAGLSSEQILTFRNELVEELGIPW